MPTLGQIIREIQHAAAALPTDALRHEIEMSLDVQDAAIDLYFTIPPGGRTVEDLIIANSTVMVSVLTTALLCTVIQDEDEGVIRSEHVRV